MPATDLVRKKLAELPHNPGVYLMKDRFGTVIYVGKARDLRKRVSQYFHPSRRMGWDLKSNALVEAIHDVDVHVARSEAESVLLRESSSGSSTRVTTSASATTSGSSCSRST